MNPRLEAFLRLHRKVGLDTSLFIFQVEANPRDREVVHAIFEWLEGPRGRAVTSTITMLEMLVQPYRLADRERVNRFYALLSTIPHLEWIEVSLEIADQAARLRAEYNLRTPDAIQVATALQCQASGFISNDSAFKKVVDLDVLIVDEVLGAPGRSP